MTNRNKLASKLFILMAVLLVAWIGVSCKSKSKPGEEEGWQLEKPEDKVEKVGDEDGMINDDATLAKYDDEMIHIRHIAESGDGTAYYRNPVITTFGAGKKTKMAIFFERRYGDGGQDDVGVDGKAEVDIAYLYSPNGGNTLDYSEGSGKTIGITSARGNKDQSKASPVVFTDGDKVTVFAASGSGYGRMEGGKYVNEGSKIEYIEGNADNSGINFDRWKDISISYTVTNTDNSVTTNEGSAAIKAYIAEKITGAQYGTFYLSGNNGKISSGGKWVLPVIIIDLNLNDRGLRKGHYGVLLLYSEDKGANWKFGQAVTYGGESGLSSWAPSSKYRESVCLFTTDSEATIGARHFNHYKNGHESLGVVKLLLQENQITKTLADVTTPGLVDAEGGSDMAPISDKNGGGYYFINTRDRNGIEYNKNLTLGITTEALGAPKDMLMSQTSGTGSVAVLEDGTIVTVAEEAFVDGSSRNKRQFNIVQRRFTHNYVKNHDEIKKEEQYINF